MAVRKGLNPKMMRRGAAGVLLLGGIVAGAQQFVATRPVSPASRAEQIIQALDLRPQTREGGLRGVIGRTMPETLIDGKAMAVQSRNYDMLTSALPIRYLHRLESEETHILVEGGPVEVFVICPSGRTERDVMGRDYGPVEDAVVPVPAGCWQAAKLLPGAEFALMVSTQAPEWRSDHLHIGAGPEWIRHHERKGTWATPELLRELIGPNWQP
ncbi:cupin domain-containing protein [Granulicella cerasi]|uniref:Cupin domain-containing protein n=1 Tax=Granulicella cerasi TaxID=741063 RepID=A0ABW1ZA46_9BACT|nr:cupin domain-containing protein [Granulicella cerasi]